MSLQFGTFPEDVDDSELFPLGDDATLRSQGRVGMDLPPAFEDDSVRSAQPSHVRMHTVHNYNNNNMNNNISNLEPYLVNHNIRSSSRSQSRPRVNSTGLNTRYTDPGVVRINPVTNAPRMEPYDAYSQRRVLVRQSLMESERIETAAIAAAAERIHSQVNAKLSRQLQPQSNIVVSNNGNTNGIVLEENNVQVKYNKTDKIRRSRPNGTNSANTSQPNTNREENVSNGDGNTGNTSITQKNLSKKKEKSAPPAVLCKNTEHTKSNEQLHNPYQAPLQLPVKTPSHPEEAVISSQNSHPNQIDLSPSELALVNCLRNVPKLDEHGLHAVLVALQSKGNINTDVVSTLLQSQNQVPAQQPQVEATNVPKEIESTTNTNTTKPMLVSPTASKKKMMRPIIQVSLTSPQVQQKQEETFKQMQQQLQLQMQQQIVHQMQQQMVLPLPQPHIGYVPTPSNQYGQTHPPTTPTVYSPPQTLAPTQKPLTTVVTPSVLEDSFEEPSNLIDFYNNIGVPIESSRKKQAQTSQHTSVNGSVNGSVVVPVLPLHSLSAHNHASEQARHIRTQSLPAYTLQESNRMRSNDPNATSTTNNTNSNMESPVQRKRPSTAESSSSSKSRMTPSTPMPSVMSPNAYKRSSTRSNASSVTHTPIRSGYMVARALVDATSPASSKQQNASERKKSVNIVVQNMIDGDEVQRKMDRKREEEALQREKQQLESDRQQRKKEKQEEEKLQKERDELERKKTLLYEQEERERMLKKKKQEEEEEKDRLRKKKQLEDEEAEMASLRKKKLQQEEEEEMERVRLRKKRLLEEEEEERERLRKKKLQQEEEEDRERQRKRKLEQEEEAFQQERQKQEEAFKQERQKKEEALRLEALKAELHNQEEALKLEALKAGLHNQEEAKKLKMQQQQQLLAVEASNTSKQSHTKQNHTSTTRGVSIEKQHASHPLHTYTTSLDTLQKDFLAKILTKYPDDGNKSSHNKPTICDICEEGHGIIYCIECQQYQCFDNDCVRDMHVRAKHELVPYYHKTALASTPVKSMHGTTHKGPSVHSPLVVSPPPVYTNNTNSGPICMICEDLTSTMHCHQCSMTMCADCDVDMHTGPTKGHKRAPLQSIIPNAASTPTQVLEEPAPSDKPKQVHICGICEDADARVFCVQCSMYFCTLNNCDGDMHMSSPNHVREYL